MLKILIILTGMVFVLASFVLLLAIFSQRVVADVAADMLREEQEES